MIFELVTWLITAIAIIGVVANIQKRQWCFVLWIFSNSAWAVIDYYRAIYAQAFLFTVYALLAVWGLYAWRVKK